MTHKRVVPVRRDVLDLMHNGSVEAIRRYLEAHTVAELADRHDVERNTIITLEHKYGARCQRTCCQCKRQLPAVQMRKSADGRIGLICVDCTPINHRSKSGPPKPNTAHWARTAAEFAEIDPFVYLGARQPWSRADGIWTRFWQGRALHHA